MRLIIHGRVQGVGFRYWTEGEALTRGLKGWVRNRADGTVETLLSGDAELVENMIQACGHGPSAAVVNRIERFDADHGKLPERFQILADG
ncbi:MAG: acylphosphatase [Geminicoccaceae bacterium]